ncbi:MAG: ComEA family DNA-binding protein [Advenella sp.]
MLFYQGVRPQAWLLCFVLGLAGPVLALDLNQATRSQLRAVKGIGDKLADRILSGRAQGRFISMEDFAARVPGVGTKKLKKLRNQGLTVGGLSANSAAIPQGLARPVGPHFPDALNRPRERHSPDSLTRPKERHSSDADRLMPAGRVSAITYGSVDSSKSSSSPQSNRPLPAMPMLIRPRPRATEPSAVRPTDSAGAGQQEKTH